MKNRFSNKIKNGCRWADRPRRPSAEADRPTPIFVLMFIGKSIFHFIILLFKLIMLENSFFYIIP